MLLEFPSPRSVTRAVVVCALTTFAATAAAESGDFGVREGYLSASVRELVESHEWSLVWSASEDRVISHSFTIANDSLRGALESLFSMYGGQFVADLYQGNRVVVVNTPPPGVDVDLPGAHLSSVTESAISAPGIDAASDDRETTMPLATRHDAPGNVVVDGNGNIDAERIALESP